MSHRNCRSKDSQFAANLCTTSKKVRPSEGHRNMHYSKSLTMKRSTIPLLETASTYYQREIKNLQILNQPAHFPSGYATKYPVTGKLPLFEFNLHKPLSMRNNIPLGRIYTTTAHATHPWCSAEILTKQLSMTFFGLANGTPAIFTATLKITGSFKTKLMPRSID
jgi:hypothetical protein